MGGGGGRVIRSRMRFLHLIIMIAVTILILQAVVASEIGEDKDHHHQISKTPQLPVQPWMKNWNDIKQTISTNLFRSFLFPPIGRPLASKAAEGTGGKEGVETTGEKMKDAMGKSVDKAKQTIEDSAKSAADKLKKTLYSSGNHPQEL